MRIPHLQSSARDAARCSLIDFPRPDRAAADAVRAWAQGCGVALDPDRVEVVTLHYRFDMARRCTEAVVVDHRSMTQAMLSDWAGEMLDDPLRALFDAPNGGDWPTNLELVDSLGAGDAANRHQVAHGLFRRSDPQRYDESTRVHLPVGTFQQYIQHFHLHDRYVEQLDRYWAKHRDQHARISRLSFIAACNKQAAEHSLSRKGVRLAWQVAGLTAAKPGLRVRALNVYGYAATDILYCQVQGDPLVLLYIPGNASPLFEFATEAALKDWFASQCKDTAKRAALMGHFNLDDEADGLSYSGLKTALGGLAAYPELYELDARRSGFTTEGHWPPQEYVNYEADRYSPDLSGDLFVALTTRYHDSSYRNADAIIATNAQRNRVRWLGYLSAAITYLAPFALLAPELAIVFAAGGLAQFALGLDLAIEGRSQDQRADGVTAAFFGLLNAVPALTEVASKPPLLYQFRDLRLNYPRRVNGQVGFVLSPMDAPRLPAEDVMPFFSDSLPRTPLPGADPDTYAAVIRLPNYQGGLDRLQGTVSGYGTDLLYDVEHDAFIRADAALDADPAYFVAAKQGIDLQEIDPRTRPVTDDMRMATLRALDVDLPLPLEIPDVPLPDATPIPAHIFSVWVGEQPLPAKLIDNLANNAERLAGTRYRYTLYLSEAAPQVFAEHVRVLGERAPTLQVRPLEQQPVFHAFRDSSYYAQYRAAMTGSGQGPAHYASAVDVLRYRLLHEHGGLYMDADDSIKAVGEHDTVVNGDGRGTPGEAIDDVVLATTREGLLLHPEVGSESMRGSVMYNNSLIGSHPGNPTLNVLSDTMLARFEAHPHFYDRLPQRAVNPVAFNRYAANLSYMTGPGLLTGVVDHHLPVLARLRQLAKLIQLTQRGANTLIDAERVQAAYRELLPLDRIARIGTFHSWAQ